MKFSIITPMYNTYHLMKRYFESLERQTYKDFEVIIIDDCSTDDSYKKLFRYKKDSKLNITVLKTEKNSGPGIARNIGLEEVKGQYITFVDSDDYIDSSYFEDINNVITNNAADVVILDYYKQKKGNPSYVSSLPTFKEGFISVDDAIAHTLGCIRGKLYKTEIVKNNNIVFPNLMRFEDMVFNHLTLSCSRNIFYLKKPLYHYLIHEKSIVHSKRYANENYAIEAFNIIEDKLKAKYPASIELVFAREVLYTTLITLITNKANRNIIIDHIDNLELKYPNWYNNRGIQLLNKHQQVFLRFIHCKFFLGLYLLAWLRNNF